MYGKNIGVFVENGRMWCNYRWVDFFCGKSTRGGRGATRGGRGEHVASFWPTRGGRVEHVAAS